MAIVLDDVVVSAPTIQSKITGGSASITLGQWCFQTKLTMKLTSYHCS